MGGRAGRGSTGQRAVLTGRSPGGSGGSILWHIRIGSIDTPSGFRAPATLQRVLDAELVKNKVRVRTELDPDLPLVFGDRVQLQQVILNLMVNGVEAMNEVESKTIGRTRRDSNSIGQSGFLE